MRSLRTLSAITISSSAALPARSPMPLTVHSTWRAPASTPASELATARPRSLWQWVEKITLSASGTRVAQHRDQLEIFLRRRIAHRVGNIDRGGARPDRQFHAAAEEIALGAGGVLGAPFHIVGEVARARDRRADRIEHRVRAHLQLVLHMDRAGGDEGVDARTLGALERFAGAVDILEAGARQAADHRVLHALGDFG